MASKKTSSNIAQKEYDRLKIELEKAGIPAIVISLNEPLLRNISILYEKVSMLQEEKMITWKKNRKSDAKETPFAKVLVKMNAQYCNAMDKLNRLVQSYMSNEDEEDDDGEYDDDE